jgi:hypothetical protein
MGAKTHGRFVSYGTQSLRKIGGCVLVATAFALAAAVLGQTNADTDLLQTDVSHSLKPVAGVLRTVLWLFGSTLLIIASVVTFLRRRVNPSLYHTAADAHWAEEAAQEAAVPVEQSEFSAACDEVGKPKPAEDGAGPVESEVTKPNHTRLYTPASGPAWTETMLNAFLSSCLKANCLGRAWQEEAARRQPAWQASVRLQDPREAEFIRKLKARWHEFHVDPENGIFVEHVAVGLGSNRVGVIEVSREKHAVTRAALNVGFVIESVGRYLKGSDVVYPNGLGCYHVPNGKELTALSDEDKKRLVHLRKIPDPWHAMIAGLDWLTAGTPGPTL